MPKSLITNLIAKNPYTPCIDQLSPQGFSARYQDWPLGARAEGRRLLPSQGRTATYSQVGPGSTPWNSDFSKPRLNLIFRLELSCSYFDEVAFCSFT